VERSVRFLASWKLMSGHGNQNTARTPSTVPDRNAGTVTPPARPDQALAALADEFPRVPAEFRMAVLHAYTDRCGMPMDTALTAARQRITDACAQ